MTPKGGTFLLLLILACAALAKRPDKKPNPGRRPLFKDVTKKLASFNFSTHSKHKMRKCQEKGYPVPKKEELKTVFNNSDLSMEDGNSSQSGTFQLAFMNFLDSAYPVKDSLLRPPLDHSDKMTNMIWNCSNLPVMIKLMRNSSEALACYMRAFVAPLSWVTLTKRCENIKDSDDYDTLLWAAKPAWQDMPSTRVKFPPKVDRIEMKKMMKMLHELYEDISKNLRTRVVKWAKRQITQNNFNCTMRPSSDSQLNLMERCNSSLKWLDMEGLTMMGPFLSSLALDDVDSSPTDKLCEFFSSGKFKSASRMAIEMKPSLAKKFLKRFQECFSGKEEFAKHVDKLGTLACYYDAAPDLAPELSRKLLSELKDCDNPRCKKLKRHLVRSEMSRSNTVQALQSVGSSVTLLPPKQLSKFSRDDLKEILKDLKPTVQWTKSQLRTLLKKMLGDRKCKELSFEELKTLWPLANGLPRCVLKQFKTNAILNDKEAQENISKRMTKGQLKALLQGLRKGVDLPELAQKLDGNLFGSISLSNLAKANITSLDQVQGKTCSVSQALYLVDKLKDQKLFHYRRLSSTLQGITFKVIDEVADKDVKDMARAMTETPRWLSKVQAGYAAAKLFATLEKTRADYFKNITEEEMEEIPTCLLIHLPPSKVKDLPASVCHVFLDKMETANLSSLPRRSPSRLALTKRALLCLASGEDLSKLTTEDVLTLGPLLCELQPSHLRGMSPDVLNSSLQDMASCQQIPKGHRADLIQLLTQTFGKPSDWSAETMEDLGPLLLLDDDAISALPNKPWMKDVLNFLKPRLPHISTALKKKLFFIITSNAARKKRAVNSDINDDDKVRLIEDLEKDNVFWTAEQLDQMSAETFSAIVETLGSVPNYNAKQLAVLSKKANETLGPVSEMTENDVSQMGCITQGFPNTDLEKLPFSLDTLEEIAHCGWHDSETKLLWKTIAKYNNLTAQQLGTVEMVALSRFICGLNNEEISQLNMEALKDAMGSMDDAQCSFEVTRQFKSLAVSEFGDSKTWTMAQVSELGNIMAGLDGTELASLDPSVCPFLKESCIPLIPPDNFAFLSVAHLENLGPDNAAKVTKDQQDTLRDDQLAALERALTGTIDQNPGQSRASTLNVEGISAFMKPLLVLLTGFLLL